MISIYRMHEARLAALHRMTRTLCCAISRLGQPFPRAATRCILRLNKGRRQAASPSHGARRRTAPMSPSRPPFHPKLSTNPTTDPGQQPLAKPQPARPLESSTAWALLLLLYDCDWCFPLGTRSSRSLQKRDPSPTKQVCGQLKGPALGAKPARHERCQH